MDDADLVKFSVTRAAGNKKFRFAFTFKGIPTADQHQALEAAALDALTGQLHALSVRSNAVQANLGIVEPDED